MEDRSCPNCNLDIDEKEMRENFLRCPNCGHDLSEPAEEKEEDWEEGKPSKKEDEDKEEEEKP